MRCPRDAPFLIWDDPPGARVEPRRSGLPWPPTPRSAGCSSRSPGRAHASRGASPESRTLLVLWSYDSAAADVVLPLPEPPHYTELVLRGMARMVPGFAGYLERMPRAYVDGGYYAKTRENRPLIGPLPVDGAYVSSAYSGFGIMASCAGGELVAAHVTGSPLPGYAPAFSSRATTIPRTSSASTPAAPPGRSEGPRWPGTTRSSTTPCGVSGGLGDRRRCHARRPPLPTYTHSDVFDTSRTGRRGSRTRAGRAGRATRIAFRDVAQRILGDVAVITGVNEIEGPGARRRRRGQPHAAVHPGVGPARRPLAAGGLPGDADRRAPGALDQPGGAIRTRTTPG